jgi:hypothetical protein
MKISDDKNQLSYMQMNEKMYNIVKVGMLDKTKNILIKYNKSQGVQEKIDIHRKQMDLDHQNVTKHANIFYEQLVKTSKTKDSFP